VIDARFFASGLLARTEGQGLPGLSRVSMNNSD
jgi:hypothetical protein